MRSMVARGFIYAGLAGSRIEKACRKWSGKIASQEMLDEFIAKNGITPMTEPMVLGEIVASSFTWRPDRIDYPKDPMVFLYDGRDDCDGFALFTEFMLSKAPTEDLSRVYVKTKEGKGHVVCVCRHNGFTYCLGNWKPFQLPSNELPDIAKIIASRMNGTVDFAFRFKYYSCVEQWTA